MDKPAGLAVGGTSLSDHNRTPIDVSHENTGAFNRSSDGTMHAFVLNRKRTVSTAWDMLPENTAKTVDNFAGAQDMITLFGQGIGPYTVTLSYDTGETEVLQMFAQEFAYTVQKRWEFSSFYAVTLSLVEV